MTSTVTCTGDAEIVVLGAADSQNCKSDICISACVEVMKMHQFEVSSGFDATMSATRSTLESSWGLA